MATIREVAKHAGVSPATVSHVLHGRAARVSEATRLRVLAAVRELGYRPPAAENRQSALRTHNIVVAMEDMAAAEFQTPGYLLTIIRGVLEASLMRGYSMTVFVERIWSERGNVVRQAYDGRCDGIVLVAPTWESASLRSLHERGTPLVLVGTTSPYPDVSSVDIDNEHVGREAVRRLAELGHRRLVWLGPKPDSRSAWERAEAFLAEARTRGLEAEAEFEAGADPSALIKCWKRFPERRPTAAVCWNDTMAADLVTRLRRARIRVPEDVSVVGVDGDPSQERLHLATFPQPLQWIGRRAGHLLIDQIESPDLPRERVRIEVDMIPGKTIAPPPR